MKIKNTILSVLITVLASGMFFAACNENPIDPGTSGAPSVPTGLMAVSKSASVVSLKWSSTSDTGVVTYKISWKSAVDSGATTATSTTADATNLKAGEYVFSVVAVRNGISSSAASIMWAGATRYSNDAGSTGETIKIYEFSSSKGSAITLDPSKPVSYTHLRAHETVLDLVCRLLLEKKKRTTTYLVIHFSIN